MEQVKPYSAITDAQIDDWKIKYNQDTLDVVSVPVGFKTIPATEEGTEPTQEKTFANFILKIPGRSALDAIGQHGMDKKVAETNKVLIANSVLGGDMDILENN